MNGKMMFAVVAAMSAMGAMADFEINIDPWAQPIKDLRKNDCGTSLGLNGSLNEFVDTYYLYEVAPDETAHALRESGARLLMTYSARYWAECDLVTEERKKAIAEGKTDPKDWPKHWYAYADRNKVWGLWKKLGIKTWVCLDCHKDYALVDGKLVQDHALWLKQNLEFIKWLLDNGYKDTVVGFRLGNEPYWGGAQFKDHAVKYADQWKELVPEMRKLWKNCHIGINIAEYFDNDPDVAAVRNRSLGTVPVENLGYFKPRVINQWSAQCILRMKENGVLQHLDHIDYHGYGADSPYSGSYHGIQRFRKFMKAFPELDHIKKMWITEWRDRSDEANRCHQAFNSSLWKAHYMLTALAQPDIDGTALHCPAALAGTLSISDGNRWFDQWDSMYSIHGDIYGKPRLEVGPAGPLFRLYNEALVDSPLILKHGVNEVTEGEDRFFAGTRYYDSFCARRKAIAAGRTDGWFSSLPKIEGSVEWVAARNAHGNYIRLLMVNTTDREQHIKVTVKDHWTIQPLYRTFTCDQDKIYAMYVPGENPPWRTMAWEDTLGPGHFANRVNGEWAPLMLNPLTIRIGPNSIQTVSIPFTKPDRKE